MFVPEVGQLYYGKVVRILQFGAFVELAPGKDGMVHISKLADHRVEKVEDVVNIGGHDLGQGHRHRRQGPGQPVLQGRPEGNQGQEGRRRAHQISFERVKIQQPGAAMPLRAVFMES